MPDAGRRMPDAGCWIWMAKHGGDEAAMGFGERGEAVVVRDRVQPLAGFVHVADGEQEAARKRRSSVVAGARSVG